MSSKVNMGMEFINSNKMFGQYEIVNINITNNNFLWGISWAHGMPRFAVIVWEVIGIIYFICAVSA